MAHNGANVILVDCDLRKHSLSAELAPGAEFGLLDVMAGRASLRETTWIEPTTQLAPAMHQIGQPIDLKQHRR